MKAIGYRKAGSLDREDALIAFEAERPSALGHDVLVRVQAVSVNPVDCKIRTNRDPSGDTPAILGWDAVGEVVEIGEKVTRFNIGDIVWYAGAIDRDGTNAEYHVVDARIAGRAPQSISATEAAALPLTTLTAYEMLFDRLRVHDPVPGAAPAVLIIGGAGGVGSIAIQLLRAKTDLHVIATASRDETRAWVKELGAHHVIDHSIPLAEQVEGLGLGAPGFVFSTTHTHQYLESIAELIAPQGRFGLIDDPDGLDIRLFKQKSISTHWEFMYTRSLFGTPDIARQGQILDEVAGLVDAGQTRSTATENLGPLSVENLRKAHEMLESKSVRGKLVLEGF
ncbi:zinc-binding alcohol dehydrogenase family protein [Altererythrobacter lutimaris]|uniref:Zinc-type alcohol dehydrogenase-like protein n=1 Tax=Altererythrobacter lutimaris TaxID=2743979 RepID=A0A850HI58_9SPHN|nr:zinc-binding alcohol dehydrogenase family protein [Altererythrobacter lutimaris]NVE95082.1 zinc-binding alcohol dehydrogenase family protein [Altererythrobacter lutimaris]